MLFPWSFLFSATCASAQVLFKPQYADQGGSSGYTPSVTIDLSSLFDNRAFAMSPGDDNFDGLHSKYLVLPFGLEIRIIISEATCKAG